MTPGSNAGYDIMKQAHHRVIDTYFTGEKQTLLLEALALLGDGQGNEIDVNDRYVQGISEYLYVLGDVERAGFIITRDLFTAMLADYARDYFNNKPLSEVTVKIVAEPYYQFHVELARRLHKAYGLNQPPGTPYRVIDPALTIDVYQALTGRGATVGPDIDIITVYANNSSMESVEEIRTYMGESLFKRCVELTYRK